MDPQNTSQPPNLSLQPHRTSITSQAKAISSKDRDPRDNFDYNDYGPSNVPSKRKEGITRTPSPGSQTSVKTANDGPNAEELMSKLEPQIWEKQTKGTRARQPDGDHLSFKASEITNVPQSPASSTSSHRRRRREHQTPSPTGRDSAKTRLRKVMLNWGKQEGGSTERTVLNASVISADAKTEYRNSVIWQHSEFDDISLEEFETLTARLRLSGLRESDIGLAKRLLKRVKLVSERAFVGGSFLTPTAVRYDMLDDSRYGVDKCCIFLSFPYFAIQKAGKPLAFKKGDSKHPTRTLLQSRYRLNETIKRDESQCIRMLDTRSFQSCVQASEADALPSNRKLREELIFVPQLWALFMGLDHMVTAGPVSDQALQGSTILLKDAAAPPVSQTCEFVRISFIRNGMPQEVTYPRAQCTSWFELLNKHQQIRNALGQGKEKAPAKDYPLEIAGYRLEDRTWASVQQSTKESILDLWMRTPKPPKVKSTTMIAARGQKTSKRAVPMTNLRTKRSLF